MRFAIDNSNFSSLVIVIKTEYQNYRPDNLGPQTTKITKRYIETEESSSFALFIVLPAKRNLEPNAS